MYLPPLNAFRVFEAVARVGHIGAAAAELHVTSGAVSQQIRGLQTSLGVDLFEKRGRRLVLTERGTLLHISVSAAMQEIAEGIRSVTAKDSTATMQTVLTVCIPPTFGVLWMATRLFSYMSDNKHVNLQVVTSKDPNLVDWRKTDVAVVFGVPPWPGFWWSTLDGLYTTPVCSPQLLRGPHAIRLPSDIVHHRLLHEDDGSQWRKWLLHANVPYPISSDVYFDDFGIVLQAARDGYGVALSDEVISSRDLDEGTLVQPVPMKVRSEKNYHCICSKERLDSPVVAGFVEWLMNQSSESARARKRGHHTG